MDGSASRFATWFKVRYYEADALGHVNNAAYLHYLEHAAIEHCAALGYPIERFAALGGNFIVRRHEIDYVLPASPGDTLQVVTWPVDFHGARATRAYTIYRHSTATASAGQAIPPDRLLTPDETPAGDILVRAKTIWVWVDPTGRPRRVPAELFRVFFGSAER
jgi:acyl-CoA thioester hydrolase